MKRADIILRYGDEQIEEAVELRNLVVETPVDTEIQLNIWRNGKNKELTIMAS